MTKLRNGFTISSLSLIIHLSFFFLRTMPVACRWYLRYLLIGLWPIVSSGIPVPTCIIIKGKPKGKGKVPGKGKGPMQPKGHPAPTMSSFQTKAGEPNHGHLKCHFCHVIGHIKPNCRKWLALQTSEQYKQRNSHEPKYQLIYDHLEDSVLAPRLCQYCSDSQCDGENCESPFDHDDY